MKIIKRIIIFISLFITSLYITSAVNIMLSSGTKLDNNSWNNLSGVLNKIDVSGDNINMNGKLSINGKICDLTGKCLGDSKPDGSSINNPGESCKRLLADNPSFLNNSKTYFIKPTLYIGEAFPVYCDMESENAGGGWTLIVAQNQVDSVTDWTEGMQVDYNPILNFTDGQQKSFSLGELELPKDRTEIAFGRATQFLGHEPIFVGYSDFKYTTLDIPKKQLTNKKDNTQYHIHRNENLYYNAHNPEEGTYNIATRNNTLTYDELGGKKYSWAFVPKQTTENYRSYAMKGYLQTTKKRDTYWTVRVR